jgi:hypothetical protein
VCGTADSWKQSCVYFPIGCHTTQLDISLFKNLINLTSLRFLLNHEQVPEIWMKPENEGYSQCIERPRNHRSNSLVPILNPVVVTHNATAFQFSIPSTLRSNCISQLWLLAAGTNNATVGYIMVHANGGLNQMRMGVSTHTY